jgi:hypothetical protein
LFGIAANRTASLVWLVKFDSPLVPGSVVHFQADLYGEDTGRVRCEDSPSLSFDVTLNEPTRLSTQANFMIETM